MEKNWICLLFNSETKYKFLIDLEGQTDLIKDTKEENKTFEYRLHVLKKKIYRHLITNFCIILDNLNESDWIDSLFNNMSKTVSIIATSTKRNILAEIAFELRIEYFTEEQAKSFFDKKFKKKRKLSREEKDLLDEYFKYDQILPYDLNLIISVLNENKVLNLKNLLDGYEDLSEKVFSDLYIRVNNFHAVVSYCMESITIL